MLISYAHPKVIVSLMQTVVSKTFSSTTVDASNTVSGNVRIISHTNSNASRHWYADKMKVYCPINGECIIDVGFGHGVCAHSTIVAQQSTLLSITASGKYALVSAVITCPLKTGNTKNCIIHNPYPGTGVYYEYSLSNITFKSVESLTNLI
eukprot:TRINITY_DN3171_c0_g1_i1.p1 TRINITY_DN3171_c0_g1~~TRINITY_DN3171_c0_g1_i1.p1  ORF type:complete len:151 (+),score=8.21 TRINITY_DN3171_c0_g1_i1:20-472(+)